MTNHITTGNMSHHLSRRLKNATGQCPVVCPSRIDNDGTVARGLTTCPVVCPVVPSLFRPTVGRVILKDDGTHDGRARHRRAIIRMMDGQAFHSLSRCVDNGNIRTALAGATPAHQPNY